MVYYNDMSLPYGGLFDIRGDWRNPHITHRNGNIVDMVVGDDTLRQLIEAEGGHILDEGDHWHVTF